MRNQHSLQVVFYYRCSHIVKGWAADTNCSVRSADLESSSHPRPCPNELPGMKHSLCSTYFPYHYIIIIIILLVRFDTNVAPISVLDCWKSDVPGVKCKIRLYGYTTNAWNPTSRRAIVATVSPTPPALYGHIVAAHSAKRMENISGSHHVGPLEQT